MSIQKKSNKKRKVARRSSGQVECRVSQRHDEPRKCTRYRMIEITPKQILHIWHFNNGEFNVELWNAK
jgi:hypothetical protein